MEKGRISAWQMACIMYPAIMGTAILSYPSNVFEYDGKDLWITPIWASLVGLLVVFTYFRLNRFYPKLTVVEFSTRIIGVIPGKLLSLVLLFYLLHSTSFIVRQYADFIVGFFLHSTPVSLIIGSMMFVSALAVRSGLEVFARIAQLFIPFFVIPLLIMIVLLIPSYDPGNLLPLLEHGLWPTIKGGFVGQQWLSQFFLISFLLPYLSDRENGMKWSLVTLLAITLTLIVISIVILLLFGANAGSEYLYPVMEAAKYISVANFFENLEAGVMALWVVGAFIKISMFYYAAALGTAQWLKLVNYRSIVFPLGVLIVAFSFWDVPNLVSVVEFEKRVVPFFSLTVSIVLPMILLAFAVIRKRNGEPAKEKSQ